MLGAIAKHNGLTTAEQKWAGKVFEATTIEEGNIALSPEDLGKKMDRRTYREHIHDNCLSLSLEACRKSIADWGMNSSQAPPKRVSAPDEFHWLCVLSHLS